MATIFCAIPPASSARLVREVLAPALRDIAGGAMMPGLLARLSIRFSSAARARDAVRATNAAARRSPWEVSCSLRRAEYRRR